MADPICCWHFQTVTVLVALLQPLWTKCISNSLSLSLIPPPFLPKDCFPLNTALELSSAILSWPMQQYTTCIIYELICFQRLNATQGVIQATHLYVLYSGLDSPSPLCSAGWCRWQPALPLCQVTHWLCRSFDSLLPRQENPVKAFRRSEHAGFWRSKVICYMTSPVFKVIDSLENWVASTSWFIIHTTSFGTVS